MIAEYIINQYRKIRDLLLSDLCWQCDQEKAIGYCPDCDDPGEWCSECLREHQAKVHGEK